MAQPRDYLTGIVASLALVGSIGATFAASCCVLPLVLGGLGAGASLFSVLEFVAEYRSEILICSIASVAAAWAFYFRGQATRSTAFALILATAFVGTASSWDSFEAPLLKIVRSHR